MQNTSADTSMQNTLSWLSWIPSGLKQKIYWNLLGFFWSFFPLKSRIHKWKTKRSQAQFEFWQYWKALPLKFRIWFRSIQVRFVCSKKSHPSTETPIWWIMILRHFLIFMFKKSTVFNSHTLKWISWPWSICHCTSKNGSSKEKTLEQIHIKMNSSSYKMLLILKCAF